MDAAHSSIPIIPAEKQYWLIRTQGGRYYNDFKNGNFIAINWDEISVEDVQTFSDKELALKIKHEYPETRRAGRTANQLRIFVDRIKKGDIVVITSYSSNKLTIGEITENETYIDIVDSKKLEENPKLCPFQKRKKVKWLETVHKYEIEKDLFKMLQHAQHTISVANEYADSIESLLHDFFIRGDHAQLALRVRKEGKIPAAAFFPMGTEILQLAAEFNEFSKQFTIDLGNLETQINVNSPGKVKFKGAVISMTVLGMLLVASTGGGFRVDFPKNLGGGSLEFNMSSLVQEISEFFNQRQERRHRDELLNIYMKDLVVETPDELKALMDAVEYNDSTPQQEIKEDEKGQK